MRERILEAYRLLDAHEGEAFAELVRSVYAPDAQIDEPDGAKGIEDALDGWLALLDAFEDLSFETVAVTEGDGRVVVEHVVHGTHTGPLRTAAGEIPATGRLVRLRLAAVVEHEGGRVRRYRSYYDQLSLLTQLGVLPAGG